MQENDIITMVDFSKHYKNDYKDYCYPKKEGIFIGELIILHWATGAIIHSFWKLNDGSKIDAVLFRDRQWCNIFNFNVGEIAELKLISAESGKIYIREIRKT